MQIFNTLTRKKELFKPIEKREVGIYTCGPTVYDYAHIGNFRAYIAADLLRRYLEYKGFKIKQVMNITDIDDKTIKGSRKAGVSLKQFTKKYEKAFFEDVEKLNIEKAEVYPKATEHIKDMVALIKILLKKGYAYKSNDGIYFDISKFKNYGKLSHLKLKDLKAGARVKVDLYAKEQAQDFALWKFWDKEDGDVFWETEIGKGRPGWHIECSTMSMKYLGKNFDIHTGGIDLIFPHHENEIAQSEAATGKKFVNYWFHNEHLLVDNKKMSKSLGNYYTLRDLKSYDAKAIRYILLSTHYKQKLNFTLKGLEAAKNAVERLNDFASSIKNGKDNKKIPGLIKKTKQKFEKAMDDDLNISGALAVIFDFIRAVNKIGGGKKVYDFLMKIDKILGILEVEKVSLNKKIRKLIQEREKARAGKNFVKADKIREKLKKRGIILEDIPKGVRWKKK